MQWIPSNVGIKGNEKADELAKKWDNIKLVSD
jgi:ribonuclease HI